MWMGNGEQIKSEDRIKNKKKFRVKTRPDKTRKKKTTI